MNKSRIKLSFTSYRDVELDQITIKVLSDLKDNTHFQNIDPLILKVKASLEVFQEALAKAKHGGKADTAIKKEAREELEYVLMELAMQIQVQSHGNEAILLSSGFELVKQKELVGILPKPDDLKANPLGLKGGITLKLKPIVGARIYQFEHTESPITAESIWIPHIETKAKVTIFNLKSGQEYAFRVLPIGKDPNTIYSNVIYSFVL